MAKAYHINGKGEVGLCRAMKNCPFGGESDHFPSSGEARAAYEAAMPGLSGGNPPLSALFSPELLEQMMAEGFVAAQNHPLDPDLFVMCYTRDTQYAGKWNDVTKKARGLIVRAPGGDFSQALVMERPWEKFFTMEQRESGWHLGDEEGGEAEESELSRLDFSAPAEVTDKRDGSMGVLYMSPDGLPALSTKGSFASDQAVAYTELLRNDPAMLAEASHLLTAKGNKTFLFELTGPENRIVLAYDEPGIVLLGAVDKQSGVYASPNDYQSAWSGGVTETMPAHSLSEAFALPHRENREGVVVRVKSADPTKQMQIKIKQEDYKAIHKALSGFSKSDLRDSLTSSPASLATLLEVGRSGDIMKLEGVKKALDLDTSHPGLAMAKAEREATLRSALVSRAEKLIKAQEKVEALPASFFTQENPAKAFALQVKDMKDVEPADMFTFFQLRVQGKSPSDLSATKTLAGIARSI